MTNIAIELATANNPDSDIQPTTEFQYEQPMSRISPEGYNYDDAIPSVMELYAGKYIFYS